MIYIYYITLYFNGTFIILYIFVGFVVQVKNRFDFRFRFLSLGNKQVFHLFQLPQPSGSGNTASISFEKNQETTDRNYHFQFKGTNELAIIIMGVSSISLYFISIFPLHSNSYSASPAHNIIYFYI